MILQLRILVVVGIFQGTVFWSLPQFNERVKCPTALSKRCTCFWRPSTEQFLTNCSNAGFTAVPEGIPINTTHLLLNDNRFVKLRNNSFKTLANLIWLDLSSCDIYQMETLTFVGLQQLNILFLRQNHLCDKNNSYAQDVFKSLSNQLQFLDISGNLKNIPENLLSYPAKALSVLNGLNTLRLDCISKLKLNKEFGNLTNLQELDFSGGIQNGVLPDDMFSSISNLNVTTVNFTNVNVRDINDKVFPVLKTLRVLDFTNNPLVRESLVKVTSTLNETFIEELYLENTCLGVLDSVNQVLKNLEGLSIKILSLDSNNIHSMNSVFSSLPLIENLTVTHNGLFDYTGFFKNILQAKKLKKLDISYQNFFLDTTCQSSSKFNQIEHFRQNVYPNFCRYGNYCAVVWPEKLEWIALSHVSGLSMERVPKAIFMNNGSVKYVDISGNRFTTFPYPAFCKENVISTVEHMDASNCEIKCVTKHLFENCTFSVKFLNLSNNNIGLLEDCHENPNDTLLMLNSVITLETLDLSSNSFTMLLNDTFDTLINLKRLYLSGNKLSRWEPTLINSVYLECLDLSYNKFQTFPEDTRIMLNELDENHFHKTSKHLSLNLLGNTFLCSCEHIQFLKWLATSKIHFMHLEQYTCEFINRKQVQLSNNLNQIIIELESKCTSNTWFICSIVSLASHFTLVTLTTVLFRFRHFLKYFILKMRMRRERLDAVLGINNEYRYDAFISCTREGAKWAKKYLLPKLEDQDTGLKFCVAQRDFLVGKTIIDNIMDTISKSRKTILLVDETFIESKWCQEELLLSHHESLSRGYNMIICIFMPEIIVSERHLPARINMLRHQVTCIKWPTDPAAHQVFWLQVERALLHDKKRYLLNM